MSIPSIDTLFGNDNPHAVWWFKATSVIMEPRSFTLSGADIWDGGTESNDPFGGAAGLINSGTSLPESLRVRVHPGRNDFPGTGTAAGITPGSPLNSCSRLFRIGIRVVPQPGSMLLAGPVCLFPAGSPPPRLMGVARTCSVCHTHFPGANWRKYATAKGSGSALQVLRP
jgi:hypothetical protein